MIAVRTLPAPGTGTWTTQPRDGTMPGFLHKDIGAFSLLRPEGVQYESRRFRWIGSIAPMNTILNVTPEAGVRTLGGSAQQGVVNGSHGTTHPTAFFPTLLNNFLGTKFKVVAGYRGGADLMLAVERGESCPCRKSNSRILVVQTTENRSRLDAPY